MEFLACQVWVAGKGGGGDGKKNQEKTVGLPSSLGELHLSVASWPEVTLEDHLSYICENSQEGFFFLPLNVREEGERVTENRFVTKRAKIPKVSSLVVMVSKRWLMREIDLIRSRTHCPGRLTSVGDISVWRAPGGVEAGKSFLQSLKLSGPTSLLCVCWAGVGHEAALGQ